MYIYTFISAWRENAITIHVHINWRHELPSSATTSCFSPPSFYYFSTGVFLHFSLYPGICRSSLLQLVLKKKKKKKLFKDKTLFLWNLVIYPSWRVWCKFVHFRLIQIVVMFLSASPLTVTPLACRGDQNSCWDPMEASRLPRPSVGESHHECFGSVTSHLSMTNFKLELFSYELAVNQQLKNHESEISDILFHVALLLIRYLCQVGWYIWI